MPAAKLDQRLLEKLSKKTGKPVPRLREQISRKASSLGITSEAALARWAIAERIGIGRFLRKLPPEMRSQVSGGAQPSTPRGRSAASQGPGRRGVKREQPITAAAIDALVQDRQLHDRCRDLLLARKHFDRVFREATTVLDDRLKTASRIRNMNPVALVNKLLNPNPERVVIEVSSDPGERQGFHAICQGIMLAFRNRAHHSLSDKFTREDALKFCGFIDTLLGTIEQAKVHLDRLQGRNA